MKAAVIKSKDKMEVCEVEKPVINDGEALIKVKYIGICGTDVHVLHGEHATATFPVIPGHEFVGELEEVKGSGSERYKVGDLVVAQPILSCGNCIPCSKGMGNVCKSLRIVGVHCDGGFAQYVRVSASKMYKLPKDIDIKLAALIEPLAVAVHDVRKSGLQVGETALIIGGGPIGILIALVARNAGARRVVISEINEYRRNVAKEMGFDVVNPLDADFEKQLDDLTDGNGFNVSFEVSGAKAGITTAVDHTCNTGSIVIIAITTEPHLVDLGKIFAKELSVIGVRIHSQYNFMGAIDIIKSGKLNDDLKRLISNTYPLDEINEAFDYLQHSGTAFKVLIKVD